MDNKKEIISSLLKNIGKDASILEISSHSYYIIKSLGYNNYTAIDNNLEKVAKYKTMYRNYSDKRNFIYREDINEYLSTHKFDIIFCIGSARSHLITAATQAAKALIFYILPVNKNKENDYKLSLLLRKLNSNPTMSSFSWKVFDGHNIIQLVGKNHQALNILNESYLIIRDLHPFQNITDYECLKEILSTFVSKYTSYNSSPIKIKNITESNFITNNEKLDIVVPLVNNFELELDNLSFAKHIIDIGDIAIINKMNYIITDKCLLFSYQNS